MAATARLLVGFCLKRPSLGLGHKSIHLRFTSSSSSSSSWSRIPWRRCERRLPLPVVVCAANAMQEPLDLTEENVEKVLVDAKVELAQIFDKSVGITGQAELADLDGPFVKIRLRGKFWHKRSMVLARLDNYLKKRIPEILEVDIEDEKQLDDSPENF